MSCSLTITHSSARQICCQLDAGLVEHLLRRGALSAEDIRCTNDQSAIALRQCVLRSCLAKRAIDRYDKGRLGIGTPRETKGLEL